MSVGQIEALRGELREKLRALARGETVQIDTSELHVRIWKHAPTKPRRRTGQAGQVASAIVEGPPRDAFLYLAARVLTTVALERLHVCPAANCGKAFVRVTRKKFCSQRCQGRSYMQQLRAAERAALARVTKRKRSSR